MGWSQADLAVEMNGTQTSVYLWERGKVLPKLDRFLTWCDTLGFDPSALLEEVGL
jgi:transcriptional regulator with XRE-family HTH domain